ncbi:spore coat protein YutH [Salipaludibacillus keqinensis]|uniref:Spore coat protein YutH n=1 Tax=Salipaludibacillus keqinensis TaxID=2045207 RepID=A0A323TDT0_9BACI|nr:spore coat protein YutH [Salipaludibacillus keqinensis]PYZ92920.1 spore coat protein YutH [Salipaludibacillus keqinensis]
MLERHLYEHFRIHLEKTMHLGNDLIIDGNGKKYLLRQGSLLNDKRILEQKRMAEYLTYQQERDVVIPILSSTGKAISVVDGQEVIICELPSDQLREPSFQEEKSIARRLAQFHIRGEYFEQHLSQGTWYSWRQRWIKRLDQLENWYVKIQHERYKRKMDELFLLSFPYFLGLTENAIQMMTDLLINDPFAIRDERGNTICHYRFHEGCWLTLDEHQVAKYKVPADFYYDHFTRDLAEYVRHIGAGDLSFRRKIKRTENFLSRYQTVRPLEMKDIHLLMARLVFPVHYLDQIEKYYRTVDEEVKAGIEDELTTLYSQTEEYETFIHSISTFFPASLSNPVIPKWVAKEI